MTNVLLQPLQRIDYEHGSCALCGLKSSEGKFMFCSKCRIVVYCSKEHQVDHWKQHKRFCRDHIWKREDPLGIAAAAACTVTVCDCKKWYSNSSSNNSDANNPSKPDAVLLKSSTQDQQQTRLWMLNVWQKVIKDMNHYGVCVVDNLLGEQRGSAVLRDVLSLYSTGAFEDGQLVQGNQSQSKNIRGDKIAWVDGSESHCRNISFLIKLLDSIVMGANNEVDNGKLGNYRIKARSKAMVACYPGSGSRYVKHVDNPNDDGRCVTAIYYLNKDWNTIENGGLLRIFPEDNSHHVADIEPLFDRVLFFWSDKRNPHEVQPAYKTRYAITVWYYDSNTKVPITENGSNNVPVPKLKSTS